MGKLNIISLSLLVFILISCSSKQDTKTEIAGSKTKTENKQKSGKDEITIKTDDSKTLSAYYYYNDGQKDNSQPLVVLIHQFHQNKDQWSEDFVESLLKNNYKVLAYDIRGHGKSSKVDYDLTQLLSDPNEAPRDVKAVYEWATAQKGIDTLRIAVVGTSIGGNLACFARYNHMAKVAVGVSNSKEGFEKLNGIDERMMGRVIPTISNVLLVCGSRDGEHEKDHKFIYENFLMDPRETKVYDSDKHGKYLLEEHPEIYTLILSWLQKYL